VSEVVIRPIELADIGGYRDCVGAVARERRWLAVQDAFPLEQSAAFVASGIARGEPRFVAVGGATIVGWCDVRAETFPVYAHEAMLGMGLLESHRGRGLGERLIRTTLEASWRAGFERVSLSVYARNERAIALYHKVGFAVEGRRVRGKKLDGEYDDVLMMAILAPGGAHP
jgi:RimJ/RimL family protein N-acetyltransferase